MRRSSNRQLLLLKTAIGIITIVTIVLLNLPRANTLTIYTDIDNCCGPLPLISSSPSSSGKGNAEDSLRRAKSTEDSIKRALILQKTQPYSVTFNNSNNTCEIDPKLNQNITVQVKSWLEVIVDSPEVNERIGRIFDSLIAHGIHPNQMAPRTPAITKPRMFRFLHNSRLRMGTYSSENGTLSSDSNYHLPHEVELNFNSSNSINNCFFDSASIKIGSTQISVKDANLVESKFTNSTLFFYSNSCWGYSNEFKDSKLEIATGQLSFEKTKFIEDVLYVSRYCHSKYSNCLFDNSSFDFGTGDAEIINVYLNGQNKIQINATCKLANIRGDGTLEITSAYKPASGLKKGIEEYKQHYGNRTSFREKLRSVVTLNNVSISKLKFQPQEIYFVVDSTQDYMSKEKIYAELVDFFKDNEEERKIYDISLRKMRASYEDDWWGYLKDNCHEIWNNYGYENSRIWPITGIIFIILFVINLIFFPILLYDGYEGREGKFTLLYEKSTTKSLFQRLRFEIVYSFLYTLLLFCVINLDWSKLKIDNLLVTFWVLLQHAVSLLLITFIVRSILM